DPSSYFRPHWTALYFHVNFLFPSVVYDTHDTLQIPLQKSASQSHRLLDFLAKLVCGAQSYPDLEYVATHSVQGSHFSPFGGASYDLSHLSHGDQSPHHDLLQ